MRALDTQRGHWRLTELVCGQRRRVGVLDLGEGRIVVVDAVGAIDSLAVVGAERRRVRELD